MRLRAFKAITVLEVYSGFVLEDGGGFGNVHDVMDHFWPGIMTLGCAAMSETAKKEVLRQHPELEKLGLPTEKNWKAWRGRSLAKLPPTLELEGPLVLDEAEMLPLIARAFGKQT
jgi:hypothetical protein